MRVSVRSGGDRRTRGGVDDRRTGAIDRGDAPRGREWRYTHRVAAAQGSSPRRKKAGFSTCFLLAARLAHRHHRGAQNDHSGTHPRSGANRPRPRRRKPRGRRPHPPRPRRARGGRREKRENRGRTGTATRREARHRSRADERLRDRHAPRFDVGWRRVRDRCATSPNSSRRQKTSITGSEVRGPSDDRRSDCSPVVIRKPGSSYGSYY